jgi:thiol-disulfide isomerase/thioredoxin
MLEKKTRIACGESDRCGSRACCRKPGGIFCREKRRHAGIAGTAAGTGSAPFLTRTVRYMTPPSPITAQVIRTVAEKDTNPSQPSAQQGNAPPVPEIPVELTDLNWEQFVEKSERPVAVMFYSPACAFCRQMEPYFREYAMEYRDTVRFARLNIMTNSWTPDRYGIRSTPTFKFFCEGKPVREMVGAVYPALLKKMVEEVLVHGKECARNSTAIDYEITGYG